MILLIYNQEICKEILLPNIYDADWKIEMNRRDYHLKRDVILNLENRKGEWYLEQSSRYKIRSGHNTENISKFADGSITEVLTDKQDYIYIVASASETKLRVMDKYDISGLSQISIGAAEGNTVRYQFMKLVSATHIIMRRDGSGWTATDTSSNGVFCEGRRVRGSFHIGNGEHINIFGLHIMIFGSYLMFGANCGTVTANEKILTAKYDPEPVKEAFCKRPHPVQYFNRSPRESQVLYKEKVQIEVPPQPKQEKEKPTYLIIGPAFTMAIPMVLGCLLMVFASSIGKRSGGISSSPFMFMGLTIAIGAGIVGAVWAMLNLKYNHEQRYLDEQHRYNAYSNYLMKIVERLRKYYRLNSEAMLRRYPSSSECLQYGVNSPQLWNRNPSQEDYLCHRLGLGEQDFQVEIEIPKEKFSLMSDTLQERPAQIKRDFSKLMNVPVCVDLGAHSLIGLVGGPTKAGSYALMQMLTVGIAAAHPYTDVKLVFLYDEKERERLGEWEGMRWLPHVWSEDRIIRFMAGNKAELGDVVYHITSVIRARAEQGRSQLQRKKEYPRPWYVLFISDPSLIEGELITKYIYDDESDYGITTFLMAGSVNQLPNQCKLIIENDQFFQGMVDISSEVRGSQAIRFDTVDRAGLEAFSRRLSNIKVKEVEVSSEIPSKLGFLEMFEAQSPMELNIAERWRVNRTYDSMRALVGRKAGNQPCYLDIHEKFHGPHGLVAGTTGSGKSETLQTYILSLAVNFSPDDVSFFVIDYKGGGMANLFSGMPHLAGQISNLSGNQVRRAMISIKSENRRRQLLFAKSGVNNINAYTRLYKEHRVDKPIPHLLIIIDEFAELKREEPDFMQELISVAQVGRSLGVHLILATQKPSGTVDDNIQANSKFRLCLRVQDRQDSLDMLGKPDAAYLTQAGRCYLQVGNDEIFELFQSGYSGAPYTGGEGGTQSVSMIGRTGMIELPAPAREKSELDETELEAVIKVLNETAGYEGYKEADKLWLPVLGEHIILSQVPGEHAREKTKKWELIARIGVYDDPENQHQGDYEIDLAESGDIAVCGNIVSGKSTFLQTMIYSLMTSYTPAQVQFYIVDFSSQLLVPFQKAPHVGGVVVDGQEDRISKFFVLMESILNERKELLKGGNFSQYVRAYGETLPAVIVVIDNYPVFREKTGDKYEGMINRIVREGVGYGVLLILSASGFGMNEIPSRTGDHIKTVISLEQQDKYKYMEVLRVSRLQIVPEVGVKGRGLTCIGDRVLEFQTALSIEAEDDFARGQKLEKISEEMNENWTGVLPRSIPEIPKDPVIEQLAAVPEYKAAIKANDIIPLGYDANDASVYCMTLVNHYCITITGKPKTGKRNVMRSLIYAALKKNAKVAYIEKKKSDFSQMERMADAAGFQYAGTSADIYRYFKDLLPEFSRRNKKKHELLKSGVTEEELNSEMLKEEPIFIFIDDLSDFMKNIYKPEAGVGKMNEFFENILERGQMHGIWFIACLSTDDEALLGGYRAYKLFVSSRRGIHAGGNLSGQKLFQIQNIPFGEQSKIKKKGQVYVTDNENESVAHEVVIPLVNDLK